MSLPVIVIVTATLRDLGRFVLQHPIAVLAAMACVVPIEYRLASIELGRGKQETLGAFAESWALSALAMIVWLPLWFLAIRQIVFGQIMRVHLGGLISAPTCRYGAYNLAILLVLQLIGSIGSAPTALLVVKTVLAIALCWFALRTTLTFTALALGRLDLDLAKSIAKTSGQTFRLMILTALSLAAILALAFAIAVSVAMIGFPDEADIDARLYPATLVGVLGQFAPLALAIAGAHVYRVIEGVPSGSQNGRY